MYNRNLVQKPVARDYFGESLLAYWKHAYWFIAHLRKTQSRFMCELEAMCIDVRRHDLDGPIPPDKAVFPELLRRRAARRTMTAYGPATDASATATSTTDTSPTVTHQPAAQSDAVSVRHSETPSPDEAAQPDESTPPDQHGPGTATITALTVGALVIALGLIAARSRSRVSPAITPGYGRKGPERSGVPRARALAERAAHLRRRHMPPRRGDSRRG